MSRITLRSLITHYNHLLIKDKNLTDIPQMPKKPKITISTPANTELGVAHLIGLRLILYTDTVRNTVQLNCCLKWAGATGAKQEATYLVHYQSYCFP